MSDDQEKMGTGPADETAIQFRLAFAQSVWPKVGVAVNEFAEEWLKADKPAVSGEQVIVALQMLVGNLVNQMVTKEARPYVVWNLIAGLTRQTDTMTPEQLEAAQK